MKITASLLLLCVTLSLNAQTYILDSIVASDTTIIPREFNNLAYADSSKAFEHFFNRLDSVFKGEEIRVHIFHIGGSHIQADIYSNKLRSWLQNMCPNAQGQRGFVFPFQLAATNNPLNYRIQGNKQRWEGYRSSVSKHQQLWGMSGITAVLTDTIDTLHIEANYKNYTLKPYTFNSFRVFYDAPATAFCMRVIDSLNFIEYETRDTLAAYSEYRLNKETTSLTIEIMRTDSTGNPEFKLMGFELMNERPGIEYTSIGVNGGSFESYKRCTLFGQQLALYKPDLFIISLGTNDGYTANFDSLKFETDYEAFMQMVWQVNPDCAILLTVPNDSYYKRKHANKNTAIQQSVIHRLARKYDMAVWDFYAVMGGLGSSQKWYQKKWMPRDRIHFTALGYSIKADLLLEALVTQWEKTCGYEHGQLLNTITRKHE
ncbi:GDSL-type esterase/lipase family protein [Lentimicrobium sp.]